MNILRSNFRSSLPGILRSLEACDFVGRWGGYGGGLGLGSYASSLCMPLGQTNFAPTPP